MAHLVEVQHERGATGGHTFHSLLSSTLPADRGQWLFLSNGLFLFDLENTIIMIINNWFYQLKRKHGYHAVNMVDSTRSLQ